MVWASFKLPVQDLKITFFFEFDEAIFNKTL